MRQKLAKLGGQQRFTFRGEFERYGYKRYDNHYSPTLLLTDIEVLNENDEYQSVTDHLWFNLTKGFQKLGFLKEHDRVQFNGRVDDYYKGYFTSPKQHDLKLSYPSKISLLTDRATVPLPEDKNAIVGLIMNLEWSFYTSNDRPIDDYCLGQFKDCKENQTYDYGVTIHTSAPAARVYDYPDIGFMDDYDSYDDYVPYDDFGDYGFAQRQAKQEARRQKRIKDGKSWLDQYQNVLDMSAIRGIVLDSTLSKKDKSSQLMPLLDPAFKLDKDLANQDESAPHRIKNNVMMYIRDAAGKVVK